MKVYKWISVGLILIITLPTLGGCKIGFKLEGQKNKKAMIKYAEEKYSSKLKVTYERLGNADFIAGREPDTLILTTEDSDAFPFKIQYFEGKISDYYPLGYMGLLIRRDIETKIFKKEINLKYVNSSKVVKVGPISTNEIIRLPESLEDIANMNNKRVDFISVIESDTQPNLKDYEWLYLIYENLAAISDRFYINISFVKPSYINEFQKRFVEEYENNYDAEVYKDKFYCNFTAEIDIKKNPIKNKEEFIERFIKY